MDYQELPANHIANSLDVYKEIGRLSKAGGWVYNVATSELKLTLETYQLLQMQSGTPISLDAFLSLFSGESQPKIRSLIDGSRRTGLDFQEEFLLTDLAGLAKTVRFSCKSVLQNDEVIRVYGALEDVYASHHPARSDTTSATYLETIINHLNDAVVTVNTQGIIISANRTSEKIFRCPAADLVGKDVTDLMPVLRTKKYANYIDKYLNSETPGVLGLRKELPAVRADGEEFPMELSLTEMQANEQRVFIGIIRDVSEKQKASSKIYQLAYFDDLTHLPNRRSFEKDFNDIISKSESANSTIYCALIDIDNFSEINLIYGKRIGDGVLQKIANDINNVLPEGFCLYRNIADSFFVLFSLPADQDVDKFTEQQVHLEHKIQARIASEYHVEQHSQVMSISIGSLILSAQELDNDKLIQLLEFAVGEAQKEGVNHRVLLDKAARDLYERRMHLRYALLPALERGEFHIVLQPQYSAEAVPVAAEALLRWHCSILGPISPDEFITIAEESGDIIAIGDWVINEVCKLLSRMKKHGNDMRIAINISAKQIVQPDFGIKLLKTLSKWDVSPSQIMLEITESTLVQNIDLVRKQMLKLAQFGFSFSIDDFGTGYSSLRYLKELPLNELKIDRYFVEEIQNEYDEVPIVNTIIEMAKAMGVNTVAEGIENEMQCNYLACHGCKYFQGYYFAKPLQVDEWLSKLQAIYVEGERRALHH